MISGGRPDSVGGGGGVVAEIFRKPARFSGGVVVANKFGLRPFAHNHKPATFRGGG